jgi:ABC-type transport system substrate-binding protein/ligand-binding sensor domain-containing protein
MKNHNPILILVITCALLTALLPWAASAAPTGSAVNQVTDNGRSEIENAGGAFYDLGSAGATAMPDQPEVKTNLLSPPGGCLTLSSQHPAQSLGLPYLMQSADDFRQASPALETLLRLDQQGQIVPWLATAWEFSPNWQWLTLHLRSGVKFQDGTDFNAGAAKYNLDLFGSSGRQELAAVASIDIVDNQTLRLNLSHYDYGLLFNLCEYAGLMISPTALEKNGAAWTQNFPVGTGPFKLVSFQSGVKLKYARNGNYWQPDKPGLDSLQWVYIEDQHTSFLALKAGELQAAEISALPLIEDLKSDRFAVNADLTRVYSLIGDSAHSDSPFSSIWVRMGISLAIDSSAIAASLGAGIWQPADQAAIPGGPYYNSDVVGYAYNPAKAKMFLSEGAYPNGFKTRLIYSEEGPQAEDLAAIIKGYLAAVGISVELKGLSASQYQQTLTQGGWQNSLLLTSLASSPGQEPVRMLNVLNYPAFVNCVEIPADLTSQINAALAQPDYPTRLTLNQELLKMVTDQYCLFNCLLGAGPTPLVVAPGVHDLDLLDRWEMQWTPADVSLNQSRGFAVAPLYWYTDNQTNRHLTYLGMKVDAPDSPVGDHWGLMTRPAIMLAVDRDNLTTTLPGAKKVVSLVTPEVASPWVDRGYDPARAKDLLTESGYPNGFKINLAYTAEQTDLAVALQGYLAAVGINVSLVVMDQAAMLEHRQKKDLDFYLMDTPVNLSNPTDLLGRLLLSTGAENYSGYNNARFDSLFAAGDYAGAEQLAFSLNEISTTSLVSSLNPSNAGQIVSLTATVSGSGAGGLIPAGTVRFLEGSSELALVTLDAGGQATCTVAQLASGSHTFYAVYSGDPNFAASTGSLLQIVNQSPLALTTTALPPGDIKIAYSQDLAASGGTPPYFWSKTAGSLPAGLGLNGSQISGIPTGSLSASKTWNFTVQLKDSAPSPATVTGKLAITINPALTISTSALASACSGVAYSQTLIAKGGSGNYSWSLHSGSLPAGMDLNANGTLLGIPQATGTFDLAFKVDDGIGSATSAKPLSLTIYAPLVITTTTLPDGEIKAAYNATLAAKGGYSPYSWAKGDSWLPGLSLSKSGVISGKPTVKITEPTLYTLTVKVTDSAGKASAGKVLQSGVSSIVPSASSEPATPAMAAEAPQVGVNAAPANITTQSFNITIYPEMKVTLPESTKTVTALPPADNHSAYRCELAVTGGSAPYHWSKGPNFPTWLGLEQDSGTPVMLSGTPESEGTCKVNLVVTDSLGYSLTPSASLKIYKTLKISSLTLPAGDIGIKYKSTTLAAAGGKTPYQWSITAGELPRGLTLTEKGLISGTPENETSGSYALTFRVSDGITAVSRDLALTIYPPLAMGALPPATAGAAYSLDLASITSGGSGGYQFAKSGTWPAWLKLDTRHGTLSGTPVTPGTNSIKIKVTDSLKLTVIQVVILIVQPPTEVWNTFSNTQKVLSLIIDDNQVWVGTDGGLLMIDSSNETYVKYTTTNCELVNNYILSVAREHTGNKWFGTNGGVSKFDGANWTTYTTANGLANNIVRVVTIDSSGNKWFGTDGGVSKFDGANWTTYTTANGLGNNLVLSGTADNSGNVWFGTFGGGVSKFDGVTWTTYTTANGLANDMVSAIAIDNGGNQWFGTELGGVSEFDGSTWTTYSTANGLANNCVYAIAIDKSGTMWFGTNGGGVSKFDGSTWTTYNFTNCLGTNHISAIGIDSAGNKWFGTVVGVRTFDDSNWTNYTTDSGPASNYVHAIAIDSAGDKWFGTDRGVSKFDGDTWTTYTTADGLASNLVNAIAIDNTGNKWFGTAGGVCQFDGVNWTTYTPVDGLNLVISIAIDKAGNKWVGIYGRGVCKFDGATWTTYSTENGLANNSVYAITVDNSGSIWFGTKGGGVSKFDGATWTTYTTTNGLANNIVSAIAIDIAGNVWCGTNGGGVGKFDGYTWSTIKTDSGLVKNYIHTIAIDSAGNKWFGTNECGVRKFDGVTWTTYTTTNDLVNDTVFTIVLDNAGNKWFGTAAGASRLGLGQSDPLPAAYPLNVSH